MSKVTARSVTLSTDTKLATRDAGLRSPGFEFRPGANLKVGEVNQVADKKIAPKKAAAKTSVKKSTAQAASRVTKKRIGKKRVGK